LGHNVLLPDPSQFKCHSPDRPEGGSDTDRLRGVSDTNRAEGGSDIDRLEGDSDTDRLQGVSDTNRAEGGSDIDRLVGGSDTPRLSLILRQEFVPRSHIYVIRLLKKLPNCEYWYSETELSFA